MATDSTILPTGEAHLDAGADMAASEFEVSAVQLTAAGDPIQLPQGEQVVRIPVQPGQTIVLPVESVDGLAAKIGPEGNLAFVIDGRTIILQGYVVAHEEAAIVITTSDGDLVDPVDVIAATDSSLDIQTAAGPAAGAQGDTAPTNGIYTPFGPGASLGGFSAEGPLGATFLQYKLIDDERREFVRDIEEEPEQPEIPVPTPEISIAAEGGVDPICVPEDSQGEAILVNASTNAGSHLTSIVISGFPVGGAGFVFDFSGLDLANTTITNNIAVDGTITITFIGASAVSFTGSFIVKPPADSDVDLGTLTATVEAASDIDPTVKNTNVDDAFVRVDAIADGDDKGDDGDADVFGVTISVSDGGDANATFQGGEVGTVTVTASFDDFTDGSETHTLTVDAPAGFTFDLGDVGLLPPGVVLDASSTDTKLVFKVDSEGADGVSDLTLNIPVTYGGSEADGESGDFTATVTTTETPTDEECDPNNNTDSASATDDAVIAEIPSTEIRIGAEGNTAPICVPEDSTGVEIPVVASTTAGSHLTTIVISGFPTDAISDGWVFTLTGLDLANTTITNTIAVDGKITITFDNATTTDFTGSFIVQPPADSDVDLGTLTATVEAANNTDPTVKDTDADDAFVRVDAIADGDDKGDDGDADVFGVTISVSDGGDANATFQGGEVGTVTVTASFDDFTDGSETHTLTVEAPAGFTFDLGDVGLLPPGVVLDASSTDTKLVFKVDSEGADGVSDLTLNIPVTYGGSEADGESGDFTATVTTTETPTDEECAPNNNTDSASATDDAVIADAPTTEIRIGAEGNTAPICVPEDSTGVEIPVVASTTAGSHLTTIVISGFPTDAISDGWVFTLTGLDLANTTITNTIAVDGKITITFDNATTTDFTGSFIVQPPADSDVDLGTLTATVEAANNTDPTIKDTDADDAFVRVDAIADGDDKGDDGDADVFGVTISVSDGGDANATFQGGEAGTVTVTASFDDFTDGSETHTLTVDAPAGFTFDLGNVGLLPPGVALDGSSTDTKLVFKVDSEGVDGVSDLTLNIPVTYGGSEADGESGDFTATVTTTETPTDEECDPNNNTDSASATDDVVIADAPTTEIRIGAEGNTAPICVPEDSTGVEIPVVASTTAGSHLTTIVISGFPTDAISDGWVFTLTGLNLANTTITNTIAVDGKITITFDNATTTDFTGSFIVQPPADSDVDLGTLTATVEAANNTDPTIKDTDADDAFVRVDAIADGDDGDGEALGVTITSIEDGGDAGTTFQTNETGTVNISATFDDYKDGSETHTLTVEAPDGFVFDPLVPGPLPAGVTVDASSTPGKLVFNVDSSNPGGVGSFNLSIPVTYTGGVSGGTSGNFTATVTAEEDPTDEECDFDNNKATQSDTEVTSTNDAPTIEVSAIAIVSDEGLTGGLKDNVGVPNDDTDSKTFVGNLTVSDVDGDAVTVSIIDTGSFPAWTFGGTNDVVDWSISGDGLTLTGMANGSVALTVEIAPSGLNTYTYTVTLHQPLNHPNVNVEDELNFDITVQASDGTSTSTDSFNVQVEDDSPVINSIQDAIMPNVEGLSVNGTFDAGFGADLCKQVLVDLGSAAAGTSYTTTSLGTDANGNQVFKVDVTGGDVNFTFYYYATFNAVTEEGEVHAFVEAPSGTSGNLSFAGKEGFFDLTANCDGTYQFDLLNNGFAQIDTVEFATAPSGNFDQLYILDGTFYTPATLPPGETPDVTIDALKAGVDDDVNTSNNGLAVDNQNTDVGETLLFDFAQSQPAVSLTVAKFTGSASQVTLVITISDGNTTSTATVVLNDPGGNNGVPLVINGSLNWSNGYFPFTSLSIANTNNPGNANDGASVNFTDLTFNSETTIGDLSLNFDLTVVDRDGDSKTVADGLTVDLVGTDGEGSDKFTLTGTGAPEVLASGEGADTISGGAGGGDTIDYSNSEAGVTVNLATNTASGGYATGDVISGLENIIGSDFIDTLTGDASANKLSGLGGNDTLTGGGGNDTITGGQGDDTVDVNLGNDTVRITSALDGKDVINGFDNDATDGQDVIDLDGLFDSLSVDSVDRAARVDISTSGGNTLVKVDVDGNLAFDDAGDIQVTIIGVTSGITKGTAATDDVQLGTL